MEILQLTNEISRIEIDMQISTAKQYPRDVNRSLELIKKYATISLDVAEDCFYSLEYTDSKGKKHNIEGPSVRLAEIIVSSWGNLSAGIRFLESDKSIVVAQAVCHDLESNTRISLEVKRNTLTSKGQPYSESLRTTTAMAAAAIAYRNVVFKVIPSAVVHSTVQEIKKYVQSQPIDIVTVEYKMLTYFEGFNVTKEMLLKYLNKEDDQFNEKDLRKLRAVSNSIKEGIVTVKDLFFHETIQDKKNNIKQKVDMP